MEIRTERLLLRPARSSDVDGMHAIFSDPEAMAHWSTAPHEDRGQTEAWINLMLDAQAAGPTLDFIIERDGEAIGKVGFWRPPELGYILRRDHWGQGLASEALAAVIRAAFTGGGLEEIHAEVDPNNLASVRLLEKHGFERTGFAPRTLEINGVWFDSLYFVLKRDRDPALKSAGV
ncbi:GNAT family N-acetyltransferase [Caulobacter mirabilis]|uniref:GNAT family N-acetyltransferase n=1 Tax=Caulobacter mirabilis TaxID=69666 RepID=A0A2D2AYE3_9CAUL|nr:GNAT family N-acetyltransferase [Caulobacter mirabilis]ATQ43012.1 GNAT family N-acetyltransferase [Caulobacter mirabilis]